MQSDRLRADDAGVLGAIMRRIESRTNNFDAIRLGAALIVVLSHSFMVVAGSEAADPLYILTRGQMTLGVFGVTVFFVVSGFLITGSYVNDASVGGFAWKRALRLMPALAVLCLLTALLLGPAVTTLSIGDYFAARGTWSYLANIVVVLPARYDLPGVFDGLPMARLVNGSLWTLWHEVACYSIIVGLGVIGMLRWPVVFVAWAGSMLAPLLFGGHEQHVGPAYRLVQLAELFRYFGAGTLAYLLRDRIRLSGLSASVAVLALGVAAATHVFATVLAVVLPVLVLKAAYQPFPAGRWLTRHGDLSYGVYLYAFPIQQLAVLALPRAAPWWVNLLAALPPTLVLAFASWRLVERPALRLKGWRPVRVERTAPVTR